MKAKVKAITTIPASVWYDLPGDFDEWYDVEHECTLSILCKVGVLMKNVLLKATIEGKKYKIDLRAFTSLDKDTTLYDTTGDYITLAELVSHAEKIKMLDSAGDEIIRFCK